MPEYANHLYAGLARHFDQTRLDLLQNAHVAIAGAGGLGSNIAMMLCRSGIGSLLVMDHDRVEASNLNRQHFWPRHLGMFKTDALAESLLELNPDLKLETRIIRLDESNIDSFIANCPLWVEALDAPEAKTMLVEKALLAGCKIVSASGLCGLGGPPLMKKTIGNLVLVGDFTTSSDMAPPLAPRVIQAASLMADAILEFILGKTENLANAMA